MQPLCGPYIQVAKFYSSGKTSSLQSAIAKFQDIFTTVSVCVCFSEVCVFVYMSQSVYVCFQDGNAGLIGRLSARVHRHSVQRLTHVRYIRALTHSRMTIIHADLSYCWTC